MKSKVVLGLVLAVMAVTLLGAWIITPANLTESYADETPQVVVEEQNLVSLIADAEPEKERKKHFAFVWLRVAKNRPKIMYDVQDEPHYLNDRNAQVTLIRSHLVLDTALQQPGIAQLSFLKDEKDRTGWLIKNLDVKFVGDSEILQIAITGEHPEELVQILLAVRAAYMDQVVSVDRDMDMRRRMTLEQAYKNMGKLVERKDIQVRNLQEQLGAPGSQTARYANIFALETVDSLRNQVNSLLAEITGLNRKIAILRGRLALINVGEDDSRREKARKTQALRLLRDDWEIARMLQEINTQSVVLKVREKMAENPNEPPTAEDLQTIQELQSEITAWQQRMEERAKELIPQIMEHLSLEQTPAEKLQEEIEIATTDRDVYQQQLDTVMKSYKQAVASSEQFSQGSVELDTLRAELARLKKIHNEMGMKLDEMTVEAQASARVQVISEPVVSGVNSGTVYTTNQNDFLNAEDEEGQELLELYKSML